MFLGIRRARWTAHLLAPALLALSAACVDAGEPVGDSPVRVAATDDVGRRLRLPAPADRVISLLPAGTETFFALGAGETVVGRTRYDVAPHLTHLPSVGGGLDPSLETIVALEPDFVVAFETAGASGIRPRIEGVGIPVFAIRTQDTTDIYRNIERLGSLVGRDSAAAALLASIRGELSRIATTVPPGPRPSVLYVASIDPPIVAGPGTFLGELIGVAGGELADVVGGSGVEWPQISLEVLLQADPDVIVLPVGADSASSLARLRSEPGWRDLPAVREGRVALVPADLMNRPGPRIPKIAAILRQELQRIAAER